MFYFSKGNGNAENGSTDSVQTAETVETNFEWNRRGQQRIRTDDNNDFEWIRATETKSGQWIWTESFADQGRGELKVS